MSEFKSVNPLSIKLSFDSSTLGVISFIIGPVTLASNVYKYVDTK